MQSSTDQHDGGTPQNDHPNDGPAVESGQREAVLSELDKILESKPFRGSGRSRQFLRYVVRHSLDGQTEKLKERTIGIEVYERTPDYATGDDPVVRVSAGEVRRRLEQYYHTAPAGTAVRIDIPLGSYTPQYHWSATAMSAVEPSLEPTISAHGIASANKPEPNAIPPARNQRHRIRWAIAGLIIAAFAVIAMIWIHQHHSQAQSGNALDDFWTPALNSQRPILICLAKPVVYRPSASVYEEYSRKHPSTFTAEWQRDNQVLPLDPNEMIPWKEIEVYPGYGIASGDVEAAVSISDLFATKSKSHQLRIGDDYSFEDLRTSPSVIIGAFNNRWTMEITSNLHFTFVWGVGIREEGRAGRTWGPQIGANNKYSTDYALVSRLMDSKTGQFVVAVAGTGAAGTQTAGEFISNAKLLEEGLKSAPANWHTKNMQIVLRTDVIDAIPGPPQVVATYFW